MNAIVIHGSGVYATGVNRNAAGVGVPGYWKNGIWTSLTPLHAGSDAHGSAIVVQ